MARLPLVDPAHAPERTRELLERMPVKLNIFRMAAHAERSFRPLLALGNSILAKQELDPELREYAILLAAKSFGGEYEWIQHVPIAKDAGASDEQIAAVEAGRLDADCFDEREKACLSFCEETARNVRVCDATFARLQRHFDAREIVELILTVGYYQMMARLTECTETDLDEPAGTRVIDAARR